MVSKCSGDLDGHFVFSSWQLMRPPPSVPVNDVRPRMEERRAPQGPVGKGVLLWADKSLPRSSVHDWAAALIRIYLSLFSLH